MKNTILGFVIGVALSTMVFIWLVENIHVYVEAVGPRIVCCLIDEATSKLLGKTGRNVIYVTYKIGKYILNEFYILNDKESPYPNFGSNKGKIYFQ